MSDGPGCPHCGTIVEPTWDWCHACGFDPEGLMPPELRAAARVPAGVVAASAPASSPTTGHTSAPGPAPGAPIWDMTPTTTPPKQPRHILGTVLVVLGGLAVLAVVAFFLVGPRLAKSVVSTKSGAGALDPVSQPAPDGTFSAGFSGPALAKDMMSDNNVPEHVLSWHGTGNLQSVQWGALPADYTPDEEQTALDFTARSMSTNHGTATASTFQGHAARRITLTSKGQDIQALVFIANGRTWILQAVGPWASQDPQATAFFTSLTLAPAP